jgi:hypothetical protein
MQSLDRDDAGRPVPYFVEYVDGKPDFRVMNAKHYRAAVMKGLCWVCGKRINPASKHVFVAGPMCLINGTSAEPPCHMDCAEWSARACPFLVNPKKKRRDANLPDGAAEPGGIMLERNPGVTALIAARLWRVHNHPNGVLISFSGVTEVRWLCEGRAATREEVQASIDSGMPSLMQLAGEEGPDAEAALDRMYHDAMIWLPEAA